MKVSNSDSASQNISKAEIQKRLKDKFGDKFETLASKKEEVKDEVNIVSKKRIEKDLKEEPVIGDIGKNDPKSETTQEKLRGILRTGAFHFNDKERGALQEILGESKN